jgi:hypothetical protein
MQVTTTGLHTTTIAYATTSTIVDSICLAVGSKSVYYEPLCTLDPSKVNGGLGCNAGKLYFILFLLIGNSKSFDYYN